MDKNQEELYAKWKAYVKPKGQYACLVSASAWIACLEANGIGDEPRERCSCMVPHNGPCKSDRIVDKDRESNLAEAIPEGYFKIGEEVEFRLKSDADDDENRPWMRGTIGLEDSKSFMYDIRRIPAWKPKDGEAVLFWEDPYTSGVVGRAQAGIFHNGGVLFGGKWQKLVANPKPFDASKIGKPWSEIV